MSSTDLAEQAATWFWQGRQAYLKGLPRTPPPEDTYGVWLAGYADAAKTNPR